MSRISVFHRRPCYISLHVVAKHMSRVHVSQMRPCSMYLSFILTCFTYLTACYDRPCSASPHKTHFIAGFFENQEADAKARGQKLPKKKDPKQEYDNFLKSIADDVQEVEARQEVEAVEAAQDKADQEAFEHGCALRLCICCTSQLCVLHTNLAFVLCLMCTSMYKPKISCMVCWCRVAHAWLHAILAFCHLPGDVLVTAVREMRYCTPSTACALYGNILLCILSLLSTHA